MSEQTILIFKILPIFIILLLLFLTFITHVVSIIKVKGYGTYLNSLKILRKFKNVNYKIGYSTNVNYTRGNNVLYTFKRDYVSCFHYIDSKNFLQCYYIDELYEGLYLNLSEHTFKYSDFKWYRKDYKCKILPDFIYIYVLLL